MRTKVSGRIVAEPFQTYFVQVVQEITFLTLLLEPEQPLIKKFFQLGAIFGRIFESRPISRKNDLQCGVHFCGIDEDLRPNRKCCSMSVVPQIPTFIYLLW